MYRRRNRAMATTIDSKTQASSVRGLIRTSSNAADASIGTTVIGTKSTTVITTRSALKTDDGSHYYKYRKP